MKTVFRVKKDGKYLLVDKSGKYGFKGGLPLWWRATFTWKNAIKASKEYGGNVEKGVQ